MRLLSAFSKSVSQRYNCNRDSLSNFVDWQTSPISYIQPLGLLTSTDVTQRLVLAVWKSRDILVDYFNRTTTTKNHQLDRCIGIHREQCHLLDYTLPRVPGAPLTYQWRIQTFHLGRAHEMRLNAKGTVGSFGWRKLIHKIITRKNYGGGPVPPPPLNPPLLIATSKPLALLRQSISGAVTFVGLYSWEAWAY